MNTLELHEGSELYREWRLLLRFAQRTECGTGRQKIAGIGTQTLIRWMKLPEFDDEFRKAKRLGFRQSVERLQQPSSAAVTTLLKVMVDPNTPPAVKLTSRSVEDAPERLVSASKSSCAGSSARVPSRIS